MTKTFEIEAIDLSTALARLEIKIQGEFRSNREIRVEFKCVCFRTHFLDDKVAVSSKRLWVFDVNDMGLVALEDRG